MGNTPFEIEARKRTAEEILDYLNFDCSLDAVKEDASAIAYIIFKSLTPLDDKCPLCGHERKFYNAEADACEHATGLTKPQFDVFCGCACRFATPVTAPVSTGEQNCKRQPWPCRYSDAQQCAHDTALCSECPKVCSCECHRPTAATSTPVDGEQGCTCPQRSRTVGAWTSRYRIPDCPVHGEAADPERWHGPGIVSGAATPPAVTSTDAWRKWFDRLGEHATAEIVNATANLVTDERLAALYDVGVLPAVTEAGEQARELGPRSHVDDWPIVDVLGHLASATDHLLQHHSCDEHGHEIWKYAAEAAWRHVALLNKPAAPPSTSATIRGAAEEIHQWSKRDGLIDGEALNEIAAILSRWFGKGETGRVVNVNAHGEPTRNRLREIESSVANGYEAQYRELGWSGTPQAMLRDLHFLLTFFNADDTAPAAPSPAEPPDTNNAARWAETYAANIESQDEVTELTRIENWSDFHAGQVYAAKQIAAALHTSVEHPFAGPLTDDERADMDRELDKVYGRRGSAGKESK